jgi:alpha-mannosidase
VKTVHLVFNAHLDPVWLWPWSAGLDELINTCSSVCDLLDRHPGLIFTRGEAWAYEMVEEMAPTLFRRIRRHVRRGQWEVVGGWYIQPDCNLPGWRNFERQIELGSAYFRARFGASPRIGYNVDSFGHAASLPDLMRRHGQHAYVMMRPQAHEMKLPANLFRWRGLGGGEVATFRIAPEYCTPAGISWDHIEKSLAGLPAGVDDTMCFVGVGDHGGGPTEALVQWCLAEANRRKDVRLVFSSPSRFFRAVAATRSRWPLIAGELQHHAIGCYSVHRAVKLGVRRAERLLERAERVAAADRSLGKSRAATLERAWKWTCFSSFHDTLGGTCLPSAYRQVDDQLGHAATTADEVIQLGLRRRALRLGRDRHQRLVLANFGARDFDDFIEHEPWLEWTEWGADWVLLDEKGGQVPYQLLQPEAVRESMVRLLFRLRIPPMGMRVLRIARAPQSAAKQPRPFSRLRVSADGTLAARHQGEPLALPRIILREENSDTWAHGIDRFSGAVLGGVKWDAVTRLESGPLAEIWQTRGAIGQSPLCAEWRFYPDAAFHDVRLTVDWREEHRALQMVFRQPRAIETFFRGIPGGVLERAADGVERPVRDFIALVAPNRRFAVVCPTVFSASVDSRQVALTLLRSCLMAHHEPHDGQVPRREFCDRGRHEFRLRIYPRGADTATLEAAAEAVAQPPEVSDLTIGMPLRALRGQFLPEKASVVLNLKKPRR